MAAKVPMIESGTARLGMIVADRLRSGGGPRRGVVAAWRAVRPGGWRRRGWRGGGRRCAPRAPPRPRRGGRGGGGGGGGRAGRGLRHCGRRRRRRNATVVPRGDGW